ncbi:ABC transporter substrate-binding protein [Nocardioides sp. zg-ZUI104]|uniref:ABC transporter substrate-binding protein n=1 Tax=Nocardioides faecalis TaxID=2803858 RepID=UPI001BCCA208|nr:ABC transporter substrate-binding protein [Nocardioides faecalis]MBS4753029.1 ABC transporter substrate-binding protein [Nocardioides faecalis]
MIRRTTAAIGARRGPWLLAGTLVAAAALTACGEGDTGPGAQGGKGDDKVAECQSAKPAGGFEHTDVRGEKVALDEVPTTVVAQSSVAAALWDAGYRVDGVYGELADDPASTYQRGNLDLDEVTQLGGTWGSFDVDAYAQMEPDLLVDYSFDGETLWYVPTKQAEQIGKLAPMVGVDGQPKDIDEAIGIFTDLATKLGVDTKCSEELNEAKDDYAEALAEVKENAGGLKVLIASASDTSFYVVNPDLLPETGTMKEAGVDLIAPKEGKPDIFHELSFEKVSDYAEADVVLLDARNTDAVKKKLETVDTWANLPAVKAGQVYSWYAAAPYSYAEYAEIWSDLADALKKSKPLD